MSLSMIGASFRAELLVKYVLVAVPSWTYMRWCPHGVVLSPEEIAVAVDMQLSSNGI
jgi:hypothetical protein